MKYMTFQSSCSYCCIANLLEAGGVEIQDWELAVRAELPYTFRREGTDFLAGAMLQTPEDFNRALRPLGFSFSQHAFRREDVPEALQRSTPCMLGLRTDSGKHAVLFSGMENAHWRFLNPHRQSDGQADFLLLKQEELLARLEDFCCLGTLQRAAPKEILPDCDGTLAALADYRRALWDFCGREQRRAALLARRDGLLRPIALDLPAMLALAGETEALEMLEPIPKQTFALFALENVVPSQKLDMPRLERALELWARAIRRHFARANAEASKRQKQENFPAKKAKSDLDKPGAQIGG